MKRSNKLTALLATLVIGFISIYATNITFQSTSYLQNQITITLNMQSGAQIPVTMAPGQTVPTQINNDNVVGTTIYGQFDPAGANAVIQCPDGSTITQMWQMAGGT